jgi:microcystin-dependent protein
LVGITHHTQGVGVNDPTKQVSVTAWQENHDGHDLALHTALGLTTAGLPVGTLLVWAGTIATVPSNFLFCNGASIDRVTYPALFTAIGTTYGSIDIDHFNLPDLRDRFIVGALQDDAGVPKTNLTGALAASGGAITHQHAAHALTQPVISNHTVTLTQPVVSNHTLTQPVISAHTLTQPVVSAHDITQPVVSPHALTTWAARTTTASSSNAVRTVSAHALSTNVAVSNHALSTNVNIDAHAFTTNVAVSAHALSTNIGVGLDAHALTTNVGVGAHDTLTYAQPFYAMAYIIRSD